VIGHGAYLIGNLLSIGILSGKINLKFILSSMCITLKTFVSFFLFFFFFFALLGFDIRALPHL
jgi:hypothetical protein